MTKIYEKNSILFFTKLWPIFHFDIQNLRFSAETLFLNKYKIVRKLSILHFKSIYSTSNTKHIFRVFFNFLDQWFIFTS